MFRKISKTILILCLLLIITAPVLKSDTIERVVAKVNEGIITLSELEAYIEGYLDQAFFQNTYKERLNILNVLIEYELIDQIAKKYNIITLNSEVEQRLDAIIQMNNLGSRENFEELLISQNLAVSLYAYKKEIKKSLTLEKLAYTILEMDTNEFNIDKPTSEEIREFYEKNINLFSISGERRIRHIVISAEGGLKEYRKANNLAEEIIEKINNGEATFQEMASQYSEDEETKNQGGDLGYFTKDQLKIKYEDYTEEVFSAEINEFKVIVTTEDVIVVQVTDIKEGRTRPFSEVFNIIRSRLFFENFQKKFPKYLKEYKEKSRIEILL
jgi:foldase protein PrsA